MLKNFLTVGLTVSALFASTGAGAVDVSFAFDDGPTSYFYDRNHLTGTSVTGILHGLADNTTSSPTSVEFTAVDAAFGLIGSVFSGVQWGGTGFTLVGGAVSAANFEFNFNDDVGNRFQLRLNGSQITGANWLFSNGGSQSYIGTGNTLGFSGASYGGTVPEPAAWTLMIAGFGIIGATMRQRAARTNVVSA